ncbi:MAG TPA: hypothetical protein DD456_00960 [Stenotrophomonas sp.]|nr:hypothetical protein [Stenotrophomonas sp.]
MKRAPVPLCVACLLAVSAAPAGAQQNPDLRNRVAVVENVRYDYAQVLNVEPVFQTLRATRTEEHCEPVSTLTLAPVEVKGEEEKGGFRRFWDSVKGIFSHQGGEEDAADMERRRSGGNAAMLTPECRIVEVGREFRRPIAYDVDYVYKGVKFRSRLPEDPGNRLKLRVSITPEVGAGPEPGPADP